jgi:glycosyltransferase involved in cell wall biosynthesis
MEAKLFWGLNRVYILYPPVSVENYQKYAGIPRRRNYVLTISRFSSDRQLENILAVAKNMPDVKFVIAGYVQDYRYFHELLLKKPPNVIFIPNVSEEEKRKLLAISKVYLNPTTYFEGFGIAIIEAMAAGLIPVTFNAGGPLDFTPADFRFNTIYEIERLLRRALESWTPEVSLKMSQYASTFSYSNFKKGLLKYVRSFLNTEEKIQ